ncbi:hypothetical protein F3Y22_tig00111799pilonHSYRG00007 [Hibiscus syriacus]|uniref:Uncharacterized protein n=3 Tax=Hibiscus syriacus TaxID=106335 RepID=A0A6A2XDB7_HIBSY|nr:hypothetical protein F3Y22_tig00111799pilonHSYRG00007 [Hibiscus syriacus]
MTHKPRVEASTTPSGSIKNGSNLSHTTQWESVRLEAEARLVRDSKQVIPNPNSIHIHPKNKHLTLDPNRLSQPRCLDVLQAWQGVVAGMLAFPSQGLGFSAIGHTVTSYADGEMGFDALKCVDESNQLHEIEETISDIDAWFEDSFKVENYENAGGSALDVPMVWDSVHDLVNSLSSDISVF